MSRRKKVSAPSRALGKPKFLTIYLELEWHGRALEDMDVAKILTDLRQERDQVQMAIVSLERLAMGRGRRRGRPPAWMNLKMKRRGRPPGSKNKSRISLAG